MKTEKQPSAKTDRQAYFPWETEDELSDLSGVVSSGECTGLVPAPPEGEAQAESYADLYPIPEPQTAQKRGKGR